MRESDHFFAAAHFDDIFRGNQHAADFVLQAEGGHTALQAFLTFFSKPEYV